jgi:hypothetical protein
VVSLLVVVPLVFGAATSLYATREGTSYYVGLANYVDILTARGGPLLASGSFYRVLLVTVLWTAVNLALHLALGVSLALLLSRPTPAHAGAVPGAAHRALGGAVVRHGARVEGHVSPAVRRRQRADYVPSAARP